jgi:hypothetical protein
MAGVRQGRASAQVDQGILYKTRAEDYSANQARQNVDRAPTSRRKSRHP